MDLLVAYDIADTQGDGAKRLREVHDLCCAYGNRVKPFSSSELTARVRAALRVRAEPEPFVLGELSIDYDARRVEVAGNAVELTATEYQLLRVLSTNAGRVLTFDSLLRQAWRGRKSAGDPKLVRAVVKRLRRKLGDDATNPTFVRNERGVGYRMPKPEDD